MERKILLGNVNMEIKKNYGIVKWKSSDRPPKSNKHREKIKIHRAIDSNYRCELTKIALKLIKIL